MPDTIYAKFKCPVCGGTELSVSDPSDDSAIAACGSCGTEFGLWGQVRAKLIADAKASGQIADKVAFKGLNQSWRLR